jgi:hypothetical protein
MLEVVIHGARRLQPASEQAISNKLSLIAVSLPVEFCLAKTRENLGSQRAMETFQKLKHPTTDFEKMAGVEEG